MQHFLCGRWNTYTTATRSPLSRYIGQVAPRAGEDGFCVGEDTAKNNAKLQSKWTRLGRPVIRLLDETHAGLSS